MLGRTFYISRRAGLVVSDSPRLHPTSKPRQLHTSYTSVRPFSVTHGLMQTAAGKIQASGRQDGDTDDKFVYKLAAAYSGKQHKFDPQKHYHSYDSASAQYWLAGKPTTISYLTSHRPPGGQDACFISEVKGTSNAAFAVADGVGGWAEQGIDSADFSHGLCTYMALASSNYVSQEVSHWSSDSPKELLSVAHLDVCKDKNINGGGSTACVAIANKRGGLTVSNLGDSGFMQLRLNKVHYYSDPQTHAFNTPYQLSQVPPKLLAQIAFFGGNSPFADTPADASVTRHELRHGDVLVFATDGVWDNLSSQDVLKIVSRKMVDSGAWVDQGAGIDVSEKLEALTREEQSQGGKPLHSLLVTSLLEAAKLASQNPKRDGPFAKAVQREYPTEGYRGGKIDDICAVVVLVIDSSCGPDQLSEPAQSAKSKL